MLGRDGYHVEHGVWSMQEAAVKLLHMEYLDLGVEQRVAFLAALTSMALACEPIRVHISAKAEALAAPSRKVRGHLAEVRIRFQWSPLSSPIPSPFC